MRDLSHLVGGIPAQCRTGFGAQTCDWSFADGQPAYPLVAALASTDPATGAVQLSCVLPLDGSGRGADSCTASLLE